MQNFIQRLPLLLRFKAFDATTEEGRSLERARRIALTTVSAAAAKAIGIAAGLITVPLTLNYLGVERYGLWMTISSVIGLLAFADLGIGNGLLNAIADASGRDDRETAQRCVSSAFFMLSILAVLLGGSFFAVYPWIPWAKVFNVVSREAVNETGPAVLAFAVCFFVNIPLGIIQRIQMGYQEGFVNSLWQAVGSILGLAAVLAAIHLRAGLPWLVLALAGAPVIATVFNALQLFVFQRSWLFPAWSRVNWKSGRRIMSAGAYFFILQALGIFNVSSDNIIITQILGPDSVAGYSVAVRLFSLVPLCLGMFITPLWSAYGEAFARGDLQWIRRAFVKTLKLSIWISGLSSLVLVTWGDVIIHWWVGPRIALPFLLLLGMGVGNLLNAFAGSIAMLFNGLNILRFQVLMMSLTAAALLVAKIGLTRGFGLPGIVWGAVAAQTVFTYIPSLVYIVRRLWPRLTQEIGK